MPVDKPIIVNQEEDKKKPMVAEIPKENSKQVPAGKNATAPDDFEVPDKLIGDDLEIEKAENVKRNKTDKNHY